jgi:DNA (cytosine-5)-methyltransferase 1
LPVDFDTTQVTSAANYSNPKPGDPCHPLAAGSHAPAVAFQPRIGRNGRGYSEDVVPALNGADAGATSDMRPCVADLTAVRRLTPTECERLQGFPDGHTLIPWRGKPADQCPDGPRYKSLGNSMAVPVMRWIGRRIQSVENLSPP